jgi:hypothetical protein
VSDAAGPTDEQSDAPGISGEIRYFGADNGWPSGYQYAATRYADVILRESFPDRFEDLVSALAGFHPTLDELRQGGGGRTVFVKRFDDSLKALRGGVGEVWDKRNIEIEKFIRVDGSEVRTTRTRDHEIDMFGFGTVAEPVPGVAVEMEWNNKDPFYDRDLVSFQALHQEGAIAIGVIVTRSSALQDAIGKTVQSKDGGFKFGQSSTHWDKLIPRVTLGGGGSCPLILIGIGPDRIDGIELAYQVKEGLEAAEHFKATWRDHHRTWAEARPIYWDLRNSARSLMPALSEVPSPDGDEQDD